MARHKHRTEVVRTATCEFVYDPFTESVPSERDLLEAVMDALQDYETDDGLKLRCVIDVKTTMRRVPIEVSGEGAQA